MKLKILIVDDKIPFLDTAIRYLNFNSRVELIGWALNGNDAIQKADQFNPDLILIDLSLPDMSGLETIKRIIKSKADQKIIVLTFHNDSEYRNEAKIAGAVDFISKDEFVSEFNGIVDKLFN